MYIIIFIIIVLKYIYCLPFINPIHAHHNFITEIKQQYNIILTFNIFVKLLFKPLVYLC